MANIAVGFPDPLVKKPPIHHVAHPSALARRSVRVLVWTGLGAAILVAAQLAYPRGRALPGTNFAGQSFNLATRQSVIERLRTVNDIRFKAGALTENYEISLADIGMSADVEAIASQLTDYPLGQRLVPLSFFFHKDTAHEMNIRVTDQKLLESFAAKVASANNKVPVEGGITIEKDVPKITYSTPGAEYRADDIANYFRAFSAGSGTEIALPFSSVTPVNDRAYLDELAGQAEALIKGELIITYAGGQQAVSGTALAPSIRFAADPQTKKLGMDFDSMYIAAQLEAVTDMVFTSPTASTAGHELDRAATADAVAAALRQKQMEAKAVMKPLRPTSAKVYPATSKGLQQLIEDWKRSHASVEPAIMFSEIGGLNRRASIDADVKYFSASVYKVFPAWYALDQMDQGKLDPNGIVAAGMKLDACFQNMIIVSSSECSESIVAKYGGWQVMDAFIKEHGISGIALSSGVSITASGMTGFLQKLDGGELLSPERTTYLLDAMKRQKYRTGFPAGSAGEVADKVGYQPKTYSWHDAGIVYHPNGKYTLVVLTHKGASLPTLSTLARQISDTLAR